MPTRGPVLVIAQELFDALPVHQFRRTASDWAEVLVDVTEEPAPAPGDELRLVLAPSATPGLAMANTILNSIKDAKVRACRCGGAAPWVHVGGSFIIRRVAWCTHSGG